MRFVVPLIGSTVVDEVRVIDEPDGASSGTLWHAALKTDRGGE